MRDFDDNEFPLAYLITLRTYGTWLHGDERGSMDRKNNVYGTSKIAPNRPFRMSNARQRHVVEEAIREVCEHRPYVLRAINARTNHVHTVVTAMQDPEPVLDAFKAYATRALRITRLLSSKVKPWGRHGSTVYLWKEKDVAKAIEYVMLGQGDDLFRLDDDD